MKKFMLMIICQCVAAASIAQFTPTRFGTVTSEELSLKEYAPDRVAEAIVLSDIGRSFFTEGVDGFDVVFERTTRIKIFTDAGIKWATAEIPIYHEGDIYEKVTEIEGTTYNLENGSIRTTKLDASAVFTEKINNLWSNSKFTMPEVHAGSVIEFHYKVKSQYLFNLRSWEFQSGIPTIYSEYIVNLLPFYSYSWLLQGATKFTLHEAHEDTSMKHYYGATEYTENVERYVMTNVPAFRDIEFITSVNDYIIKINFQLCKIFYPGGGTKDILSTWPLLTESLLKDEDFGKAVSKTQKLGTKLLSADTIQKSPPDVIFDYVINFVKRNYRWNKENGYYASKSPDKLLKDRIGNDADLNLFATGLLNAAGIEAYPLLISTREHGKIRDDYPFLHFFNYVLICAKIDGKTILADVTEPLCQNDRVPMKCLNDKGMIMKKGNTEWVSLQCNTAAEQITDLLINPSENENSAKLKVNLTEYLAYSYRKSFGSTDSLLRAAYIKAGYDPANFTISIGNAFDLKKPYSYEGSFTNVAETINNKIYIAPFLTESYSSNPFTQGNRTYPVDMIYPVKKTFTSEIAIPEGYKVDFLPEESKITNELFELAYSAVSDGKKVNVKLYYFFRNSVYAPANYLKIKYYIGEIVKKANEKLVLVKN